MTEIEEAVALHYGNLSYEDDHDVRAGRLIRFAYEYPGIFKPQYDNDVMFHQVAQAYRNANIITLAEALAVVQVHTSCEARVQQEKERIRVLQASLACHINTPTMTITGENNV